MAIQKITAKIIADGAILAADVADGSITTAKLADANVTNAKIDTVANTKITGTITASQIAAVNGAVVTANTIANSAFQTGSVENYMNAQSFGIGMRNRIINGKMEIDQRNAGASVTPTNNLYSLDRWIYQSSQASKVTIQQNAGSVTPPAGYINYLGVTSSSAYTVGASETFVVSQRIEGLNVSDLAWGTANAKTVTLSFLVYSSLTGTFSGVIGNNNATRSYPFTFAISSANTWTTISVTIPGDTSGTWLTTNGIGLVVYFSLGTGSTLSGTANTWAGAGYYGATGATSVVGTNGATFYITGVQLEKGSVATPFEHRHYGQELALCQRYYYLHAGNSQSIGIGYYYNSTIATAVCQFPVSMRTTPTLTSTSGTSYYNIARNGTTNNLNSLTLGASSLTLAYLNNSTEASGTAGQAGLVSCGASGSIAFTAEL